MIKILIITRRYYPHSNATGAVVHNLAKALREHNCSVQVMALTSYKEDTNVKEYDGVKVCNTYCAETISQEQAHKEWKRKPVRTAYAVLLKLTGRITGCLSNQSKKLGIDILLLKKYKKEIKAILRKEKYDLCIVTLLPVEAAIAIAKITWLNVPFAIYQLDTYWNSDILPKDGQGLRIKLEKELVEKSCFVITTPLIEKANRESFSEYKGKIISAEFPLIIKDESIDIDTSYGNKGECVFLGTLYPDIRPPELVLEIIKRSENADYSYSFYGSGQQLVKNYKDYIVIKDKVRLKGQVSSDEAKKARQTADVLVNIDNVTMMQVPSKIFEYFCTGKPIINFYFNDNSPSLQYFERYPYCVNVYLKGNIEQETKKLDAFLNDLSCKRVDFSVIKERFIKNTPEYVSQQFLHAYNCALERKQKSSKT